MIKTRIESTTFASLLREDAGGLFNKVNVIRETLNPVEIINAIKSSRLSLISTSEGEFSAVVETADAADMSRQTGAFDLHQDGMYLDSPPHFVSLSCMAAGRGQTPTIFADTAPVIDAILNSSACGVLLSCQLVYISKSGIEVSRPLIEDHPNSRGDKVLNLVARGFIRPLPHSNVALVPSLREISDAISQMYKILSSSIVYKHYWAPGDIVFFDNRRFLHGRETAAPDPARHLIRAWCSKH